MINFAKALKLPVGKVLDEVLQPLPMGGNRTGTKLSSVTSKKPKVAACHLQK